MEQLGVGNAEGQKVNYYIVDVTNTESVNNWINSTLKDLGKLDGAANIAGITPPTPPPLLADTTDETWNKVMDVNATGVFKCMRAELNAMKSGASIVNIASGIVYTCFPYYSSYIASKHAVVGLTKAAAKENAAKNIRVNAVAPGTVNTALLRNADHEQQKIAIGGTPAQRLAEPDEIAKTVAWLLSDDASYMHGSVVSCDGGMTI